MKANNSYPFDRSSRNREIIAREIEKYRQSIPDADPGWPYNVAKVWNQIAESFSDPQTDAGQVLRACGIRSNSFREQFKWHAGVTIWNLVVYHRVELAKRLLCFEQLSVGIIAIAIGYGDGSSFSRIFKKNTGKSPSEFRKG